MCCIRWRPESFGKETWNSPLAGEQKIPVLRPRGSFMNTQKQHLPNASVNHPGMQAESNQPCIVSVGPVGIVKRQSFCWLRNAHALLRIQTSKPSYHQTSCRQEGACALSRSTRWADLTQPLRLFSGPILWAPSLHTVLYLDISGGKATPAYIYLDLLYSGDLDSEVALTRLTPTCFLYHMEIYVLA